MANGTPGPSLPQFLVWRKLGTMNWTAFNQVQTINVDRLHGIRFIDIRFNGQVDISAGSADGASLAESPWSFMTDVRLTGNGKDTIIAAPGMSLARWNFFRYGVRPTGTALSSLSAANSTYSGLVRLDLALPKGKVPIDTALISTLFSSLQLAITIGGKVDLVTAANDRTFAFDTSVADIYVGEIVNFNANAFGRIFPKQFYIEDTNAATSSAYEILLPTGNAYRAMMLETCAGATAPDTVNTVLNNLQIRAGSEVFVDVEDDEIQEGGALAKGVALAAGFFYLDFSPDGLIGDVLDASRVSTLKAVLDKTAQTNTRTRLHALELIPV